MKNAIPILVIVTAGFAATVLAASTVCRSTVPADPPVAYYQFGDAPEFPTALDSSTNADDGVYEETSTLRVPKLNAPFTMGAWLQSIDDNDDLSGARDVLGEAAIDNYAPRTAQIGSRYQVETAFETGTLISLGLVLILFESIGRWGRSPLEFRGSDATLSRARIFQLGGANLRRRSEAELNSFSACYATARVQEEASLAGGGVSVAFRRPRTASAHGASRREQNARYV